MLFTTAGQRGTEIAVGLTLTVPHHTVAHPEEEMKRKVLPVSIGVLVLFALAMGACAAPAPSVESAAAAPAATAAPAPTAVPAAIPAPANPEIILATTTSTQDTGLLDVLIPLFDQQTGYKVKTVAVGSGEAIKMGQQGNADVLLVHSPAAEVTFMSDGWGKDRALLGSNRQRCAHALTCFKVPGQFGGGRIHFSCLPNAKFLCAGARLICAGRKGCLSRSNSFESVWRVESLHPGRVSGGTHKHEIIMHDQGAILAPAVAHKCYFSRG